LTETGVGAREENPADHAQEIEGKRGDTPRTSARAGSSTSVALWRESGLSACAFARAHGLSDEQRLNWWRKRLEKKGETALAPLTVIPAELTGAAAAAMVRLPGDVVLELADVATVPTSWVAALASEVKRQS
jgi:hypothetical protein